MVFGWSFPKFHTHFVARVPSALNCGLSDQNR
jgi:hypothetical protein